MSKVNKTIYNFKILLFLLHFIIVFMLLPNTIQVGLVGYIFLTMYIFYIIKILIELLFKNKKRHDKVYNLMQIGLLLYIIVFFGKLYFSKIYVTGNTINYLVINYIIMSFLIIFILLYAFIENKNIK